jgi:hypothetical protein
VQVQAEYKERRQMPPFAGNEQERQALAKFVLEKLRK